MPNSHKGDLRSAIAQGLPSFSGGVCLRSQPHDPRPASLVKPYPDHRMSCGLNGPAGGDFVPFPGDPLTALKVSRGSGHVVTTPVRKCNKGRDSDRSAIVNAYRIVLAVGIAWAAACTGADAGPSKSGGGSSVSDAAAGGSSGSSGAPTEVAMAHPTRRVRVQRARAVRRKAMVRLFVTARSARAARTAARPTRAEAVVPRLPFHPAFILGADISWTLEDEAGGATYFDGTTQRPLERILVDNGSITRAFGRSSILARPAATRRRRFSTRPARRCPTSAGATPRMASHWRNV